MGYSVYPAPAAGGKIQKRETLTSGTSWTVPTGVTDINVLLVGGGGGAAGQGTSTENQGASRGQPGASIWSTITTTPAASISYAIGAGGTGGANSTTSGGAGGNTTFTGATTAAGGVGGAYGTTPGAGSTSIANNGGISPTVSQSVSAQPGGAGGAGFIFVEYWV